MEKLVDTKELQIRSVKHMMEALGFEDYGALSPNSFITFNKDHEQISFSTAIKIHNSHWTKHGPCHARCDNVPWLVVDMYTLAKADASRIIKNAKLQCTNSGHIICQSNLVEFPVEQYEELFLRQENHE